jgi:DNA-binding transcriptional regulator PaaX
LSIFEGSLEVKLPTIWTDDKPRGEESEKRREEKKKEDQGRKRVRRQKMQVREKVAKSRNAVFPMICFSGGSRIGSLKRRVRSQLAR